jgi:hypothetical protein
LAAWDPHVGDEGTRVRDIVGGPHGGELGCASVEGEGKWAKHEVSWSKWSFPFFSLSFDFLVYFQIKDSTKFEIPFQILDLQMSNAIQMVI